MKFLVPNYSCLQNPWLGGYCPQIPVLSVLNWIWTPPPEQNSWVRHWCQRVLTEELHIKRVAAKFVPRLLSEDQRANRLAVCREIKDQLKTDADFLSKIITGDESWCYCYGPENKATIKSMEKCIISETKKRRGMSNHVDLLLWHQTARPLWIRTTRPDLTSSFTWKCLSDCVMLCEENAPNCGGQSGFYTMTMLPPTQHFECAAVPHENTGWQRLRTSPTPRTWHPAIFSCFQEWRGTLKESDFRMWRWWW